MTARAALCMALLEGRVLNVKNCFTEIGLSNIGREIPRLIEKPFNVIVSRTAKAGKNRYGSPVSYTDYRLNKSSHNLEGIKAMAIYVQSQLPPSNEGRTPSEKIKFRQQELFIKSL